MIGLAEYRRIPRALPKAEFARLSAALMASPFVAKSTLTGSFQASRGFGMAFTAEGRAEVERRIPEVAPFLAAAIDSGAERTLRSFWQRRTELPLPNAWYMNLLLIGSAGGVEPHVDATLAKSTAPRVVSVLYVQVPKCRGGELVLARGDKLKGVIRPKEGVLLHFRGDLRHQVRALESTRATDVRASLVLEQCHLGAEALAGLSAFRLDSHAGFEAVLAAARGRPGREFEVER